MAPEQYIPIAVTVLLSLISGVLALFSSLVSAIVVLVFYLFKREIRALEVKVTQQGEEMKDASKKRSERDGELYKMISHVKSLVEALTTKIAESYVSKSDCAKDMEMLAHSKDN